MIDPIAARNAARSRTIGRHVVRLIRTVFVRWSRRRRQRMALLALSDDHLKDIGVTPQEVRNEARRPFWD